jgi:hypothetical protein
MVVPANIQQLADELIDYDELVHHLVPALYLEPSARFPQV